MKPEYGPTLGRLLAPRWRATARWVKLALTLAPLLLGTAVLAVVLTVLPNHYSQGGKVPFSFAYRGLYRTTPQQGGYVRLRALAANGSLEYSYAVAPLELPPYSGLVSGELPVYATGYIDRLAASDQDFVLRGEGKTRINKVPGYEIFYTMRIQGQEYFGRNVLLLPERARVRMGVAIAMLAATNAGDKIKAATEVASSGPLLRPVKTFSFG